MELKPLSGLMLTLLFISMLTLTFSARAHEEKVGVKAGDWIKCDYTVAGTAKATETNMWKAELGVLSGQWLWILGAGVVVVVTLTAVLLWRRRRLPLPEEVTPASATGAQ